MRNFLNLVSATFFWIGFLGGTLQSALELYGFFKFHVILSTQNYTGTILMMVASIAIRQIKMDYFPSR
jgi:hypothetical protein